MTRNPAIGSTVGDLVTDAGCVVRDRVEERSWWTLEKFERITRRSLAGHYPAAAAESRVEIAKILWVAVTRRG